MEKDELLFIPGRGERGLKAHYLAAHYLAVVLAALLLLIKPAARAADGIFAVFIGIIIEYINGVDAVRGEKARGFGHGVPPVIVIALENYLPAGQRVYEEEILQRAVKPHAPAQIAAEHGDVILVQRRKRRF